MRWPRVRFTMQQMIGAMAILAVAATLWRLVADADARERNLHATLFTLRLVERFVSEHGHWPRSWGELEGLAIADGPLDSPGWPACSAEVRSRVTVDLQTDPREMAARDPAEFDAIRPNGPSFEYRHYGYIEALQQAVRQTIMKGAAPSGAATRPLDEATVLAIARQAVATDGTRVDQAEFERPRHDESGWGVHVRWLPETPGRDALILIDETGKVTAYLRGE